MKAARLTSYGEPLAGIALHDVPEPPAPGAGEVLVQMRYAPVNVSDLMVARGIYDWRPQLPATLGNEGAGVIVATGEDVEGMRPGTRVVLPFMAQTWRERLTVKARQLTVVPPNVTLQQAAMATINLVTAAMLLDDYVPLAPGDVVAYNAANSGLGHCIAGLASRRGLRTLGFVRAAADIGRVREAGCEIVRLDDGLDPTGDAELNGSRVRLALDGVGGPSAGRLASLLASDGALVAYGAASHRPMEVSAQHLIFKRVSVHGFFEGRPENVARIRPTLESVLCALEPGGIEQPVAACYPLGRVNDAVAHAMRGGKIMLTFGETRDDAA
ncbi:MDR family NADPH-dependent oxidoreductase [Burkholderia plantarii]|uniref:MDR family NADPH-dependent oxidoreductase n=1 Tax=Burkholderia plantarii TaxID=41899 RepID=UPI0006D89810|nr:2-enoyl thioester reductase domain-containing protein [Burkholderia plantarii]ALK34820.1 alcohol dehydrogenase [Burkholderia plantarii]GLZ18743.1 trans-2-enoyl-CoA reductase [Burkholderia plantarii]